MSKRAITIDTGCEPTDEIIEKYNLALMGMKIILDDQDYWDGKDIDVDHYYSIIENINDFKTSPPTLWDIYDHYENLKKNGYDEIIDIHFSSKMSETINICKRAGKMIQGLDVKIIDTESVSAGAFLIADKVLDLLHDGKSYDDVMVLLPEIRKSTYMQFSVPTVKYLVKNGRIGRAQAFAALVLKIKPILGVSDGVISPISKEKGLEKVFKKMSDNAFKFIKKRPHNVKIHLAYGFESSCEYMEKTADLFMEKFKKLGITDYKVGKSRIMPTVACHSGPEVFGMTVYGEKKAIG